jgi:hypothetical protein
VVTDEEYRAICDACDRLLLASDATVERVAIPWLHVLNEHPVNLLQYSSVIGAPTRERLVMVRSALAQVKLSLKRHRRRDFAASVPRSADVLWVSHLLNESQIGAADDFYFGRLPELLQADGLPGCVVMMNATTLESAGLAARWPADMAPRVFLAHARSPRQEWSVRRRQALESRRLRALAATGRDGVERRICERAAVLALSSSSIAAMRFYHHMRDLVARLRPKAIVLTYEGHAWERLAFAAARRAAPGIRCIGYHHSIVFPRQHAALRLLGAPYDPDVILTAGDIAADKYRSALPSGKARVATLGIHRRQQVTAAMATSAGDRRECCLVMPDGIVSEVARLCDFSIAAATAAPHLRFLIRLHPVVSLEGLKNQFPRFRTLPPNVAFSAERIEVDFARSRWALYRGSNAAVYAVIAGLRPFYVDRPGELRFDSLNDLKIWKKVIQSPRELVAQAEQDANGTADDMSDAAAAADYCSRYFMPTNPRVLLDAIQIRP